MPIKELPLLDQVAADVDLEALVGDRHPAPTQQVRRLHETHPAPLLGQ